MSVVLPRTFVVDGLTGFISHLSDEVCSLGGYLAARPSSFSRTTSDLFHPLAYFYGIMFI